jgi:DNA-binding NarL/FixJ family response regulator
MSAERKSLHLLTAQEEKVLKLVVKAQTNKEISAALGMSPSTVKRNLESILDKLLAAALYAVRIGDFPLDMSEIQHTKRAARMGHLANIQERRFLIS